MECSKYTICDVTFNDVTFNDVTFNDVTFVCELFKDLGDKNTLDNS